MSNAESQATQLLTAHLAGSPRAAAELLPLVYDDLHTLAARYMADERTNHTLQPTALINEAYLRLIGIEQVDWRGQEHFKAMAATMLRRVLVDHARKRGCKKRGDGLELQTLDERTALTSSGSVGVLAVEVALEKLARVNARQAKIVEQRFFGGLTVEETARVLEVGKDVVKSDWRFARAWLKRELGTEGGA